jgi:beta-phosphoglucomutase-like phosphatase (HAD superfamily)
MISNNSMITDKMKIYLERKNKKNAGIQALFFDLDGTLIDTMDLHFKAYHETFKELGGILDRDAFNTLSGPPAHVTIPLFANASNIKLGGIEDVKKVHYRKKAILKILLNNISLPTLPAYEILRDWAGKVHISIVTSGNLEGATAILRASGILPLIDALITGDDVATGKPDPEPYMQALTLAGVDPSRGIAFEDHDNGILSAKRARLDVFDVRTGALIEGENK